MSTTHEENLRKYAQLTIRAGIAARPGQEVIVAGDITEAQFMRMLAEEAYKAGVKNVLVNYLDDEVTLLRYANASQEALEYAPQWLSDAMAEQVLAGAAYIRVFGTDPALLKNVDRAKIGTASKASAFASAKMGEAVTGKTLGSFCIVAHSSPGWAQAVFPELSAEMAVAKLWAAIFSCTHVDQDDPVAAWIAHCERIETKRDQLNTKNFTTLHFKSKNGTDLKVGLADGHRFAGGRLRRGNTPAFSPNIPTEEVFTMPHKDRVDGVVKSTKPLSIRGSIIDGIEMTFEKGKAVKATAKQGEDILLGILDTDEGARHLGEVALVPNSSRVSQANMLFLNTLYDENAACHIALGKAIGENMADYDSMSPEDRKARGVNDSLIHVDWMIGSVETDIDGIKADGSSEPIMRGGEWV